MRTDEKTALTYIAKEKKFKVAIDKLTLEQELSYTEKTYILTCAIVLLKHYQKDNRYTAYADFAYYIILKYSTTYEDYYPLYDLSVNFGFYPIAKSILQNNLYTNNVILNSIAEAGIEKYKNDNYIQTLEQYINRKEFLKEEEREKSYVAPTSFGKSSIIIDHIRSTNEVPDKCIIVVPTKSLLTQTYKMIRGSNLSRKIVLHDEMYNDEDAFIGILTQERALRLLSRRSIYFDTIIIDEAHNILNDNSRSILLTRLLNKNRALNPNQNVIYLSPLVDNVNNLKTISSQKIAKYLVNFNVKEPEIFEYRLDSKSYKYNRFINNFYFIKSYDSMINYIRINSNYKNFIYNYRPINIERLALDLCKNIKAIRQSKEVVELIDILEKEVHPDFYMLHLVKHGVIYLHGKLPDLIKEYLEYKYKNLREIRYIVANSVILEGMNLPIDCLFILNTHSLQGKELMNLIGRVNRLNEVFDNKNNNLRKLLPPIHFVNSEHHNRKNSKMQNKIKLLRSRVFKDVVKNPTLDAFDPSKHTPEKNNSYLKIKNNEKLINNKPSNIIEKIEIYLIESGINLFYKDIEKLITTLANKINSIENNNDTWYKRVLLAKIHELYIFDTNLIEDFEVARLHWQATRDYYDNFILKGQKQPLKQRISTQYEYFKKVAKKENSNLYFGTSYGEIPYESDSYTQANSNAYIDLKTKGKAELVNLSIVKLKMEDDFISFKLNKFIVMLYDFNLIEENEYNIYIYGTKNRDKIKLTKYGLNVSLVSRLDNDQQLENLYFDKFNNLIANTKFRGYLDSLDDYSRFEIERYLSTDNS